MLDLGDNQLMKPYAFITGSSSGIGLELARCLAAMNYQIILHGRNIDALEAACSDIKKTYSTECLYFSAELSNPHETQNLIEKLKQFKIEVFVSNAGIGVPGNFFETNLENELSMCELHVMSVVRLSKYFMQEFAKNKKGHILNVSSLYSYFPVPKQSLYAATKSFQHSFFLSLHKEAKMAGLGVNISSLCPGLTYSNFRIRQGKQEKKSFVGLSATKVAAIALDGLFKNKCVIIPGIFNKIMALLIPLLPVESGLSIIYKMNKQRGF